ncbi:RDD family protein [Alcanivorax limicola]|uniref:RDD family protein n=1 Tax=Alcanivorax limicola TaxID=2874102 RepID=UPI001CBB721F|nr:RDD family protein [Alcanivorax limicola]
MTPEGVPLVLTLAGPIPRAVAYLIDFCIRLVVYLVAALFLGPLGGVGMGLLLILFFLLEWGYPILFEVLRHGQTPGKKALHLTVVKEDATPVDLNASLIRNLLRTADLFPTFYLAGLITMLIDRRFRRLGDLAAGTLVVHVTPPPDSTPHNGDTPLAPDWAVTISDRQLLLNFLERSPQLSSGRRAELAQLAFPELPPDAAAQRLRHVALYMQGAAQGSVQGPAEGKAP